MESLHRNIALGKALLGVISAAYTVLKVTLLTLLSFFAIPLALCCSIMILVWFFYIYVNDVRERCIEKVEGWANVKTKDFYQR